MQTLQNYWDRPGVILCQICESAYIETTQQNVEYVCTMCRENNPDREMPDENDIDRELVTDAGNY